MARKEIAVDQMLSRKPTVASLRRSYLSLRDSDAQMKDDVRGGVSSRGQEHCRIGIVITDAAALNDAHRVMCWLRLKPAKMAQFLAGVDKTTLENISKQGKRTQTERKGRSWRGGRIPANCWF